MTGVPKDSDERPWGGYTVLADLTNGEAPVAVKILTVSPGQRLSLQTHALRREEWTALNPGLRAIIGDDDIELVPFLTYSIALRTPHRVMNTGDAEGRVLEVLFGEYREDDIVRLDDDYNR